MFGQGVSPNGSSLGYKPNCQVSEKGAGYAEHQAPTCSQFPTPSGLPRPGKHACLGADSCALASRGSVAGVPAFSDIKKAVAVGPQKKPGVLQGARARPLRRRGPRGLERYRSAARVAVPSIMLRSGLALPPLPSALIVIGKRFGNGGRG